MTETGTGEIVLNRCLGEHYFQGEKMKDRQRTQQHQGPEFRPTGRVVRVAEAALRGAESRLQGIENERKRPCSDWMGLLGWNMVEGRFHDFRGKYESLKIVEPVQYTPSKRRRLKMVKDFEEVGLSPRCFMEGASLDHTRSQHALRVKRSRWAGSLAKHFFPNLTLLANLPLQVPGGCPSLYASSLISATSIYGPPNAVKTLAVAAAAAASRPDPDTTARPSTNRIHVVESYYSPAPKRSYLFTKRQSQRTLPDIERDIEQQMSKMGATSDKVTGIVFVSNNEQGHPISWPCRRKLVVVAQARDNAQTQWKDLRDAGMRVVFFDSTEDSARSVIQLLSPDEPVKPIGDISPAPSTVSLAEDGQNNEAIRGYAEAARATGRNTTEAVILLVGQSGHGKSKTINRLLGQKFLEVGKRAAGSTTKNIQRVKIPVFNRGTGVTVTLAFDDTPGGADTSYSDRASNSALIRIYKDRYFPDTQPIDFSSASREERHQTYPNIILLVASWDSIKTDAHNPPAQSTSPLGQSIYNLSCSGLVNHSRTNVVVVVTKSMSFMNDLDDFHGVETTKQWMIEAGRRRGIIVDIQRRVFPRSAPWNIVFVENGGGTNVVRAKYPILPNGELSHQNLFNAIRSVIEEPGPHGTPDLTGMRALDVLTGAEPLDPEYPLETEILVNASKAYSDTSSPKTSPPSPDSPSPPARIQELIDQYLGVTYDPKRGNFGRNRVLSLDPCDIKAISGHGRQQEEFAQTTALQLRDA
ncbi:hypothetical protein DFH08DRAFT_824051 [Mycena albidolilacea]|uniref:G domain-containing protein n=1 Tax=Mycena albidolilacea TaxID=1033008 RepID=A0AAD7EB76_9AGAR|nr:hypothetical protein DFH08DRAFT_824051 [Mycena albidolilacea]